MKKTVTTACTLDCPDACSLLVEVENDRITSIRGNPDHPYTAGFACAKIRRFPLRLESPDRLRTPLLRKGKGFVSISWEAALDLAAEKLQACREEGSAIFHCRGGANKGYIAQSSEDSFFASLGASRIDSGGECDLTGILATIEDFGALEMSDPAELLRADGIAIWGRHLKASSVHLAALVTRARKRSASVICVSPRGLENASLADRCYVIAPGTDRFLALAVAKELLSRDAFSPVIETSCENLPAFRSLLASWSPEALRKACGLSGSAIGEIADFYLESRPLATVVGNGLQRYLYGGQNVRAVNALAWLTGNVGVPGGSVIFSKSSGQSLNRSWVDTTAYSRQFPVGRQGRAILEATDPAIRFAWISMGNPVNQTPESECLAKALRLIDFTVVVDCFRTDTAEAADLVLPCALTFEQDDVTGAWGHHCVQWAAAAVSPPEGVRTDLSILTAIGARLDPKITMETRQDYARRLLDSQHLDCGLEELQARGFERAHRPRIAFEGGKTSHPHGRFCFLETIGSKEPVDPAWPLTLLTLVRRRHLHSQILPEEQESLEPVAWLAATTLARLGLERGAPATLVSPLGRMDVELRTEDGLHPDCVVVYRGPWRKFGWGSNVLVEGRDTDHPDGVAFYSQRIRVEGRP